jgi:hypothetical protein
MRFSEKIRNMNLSGVSTGLSRERSEKGAVDELPNQTAFPGSRDITHFSVLATVSLGLNFLFPLFLPVSDVIFKDAKLRQRKMNSIPVEPREAA